MKDCRCQIFKKTIEIPLNQLTFEHCGLQRLTNRLCRTHQATMHVYYSCFYISWFSYGTHKSRNRGFLWIHFLLLQTFPTTGLLCPPIIEENVLSLTVTWYTKAGWYLWEACPFWKETEEKEEIGGSKSWGKGLGREKGCENLVDKNVKPRKLYLSKI